MNHLPIKCRPSGDLQITMESKKCRHNLGRAIWELAIAWKCIACVDLGKDAKAVRSKMCERRNASTGLLIRRQSDEMQMMTTPIVGWHESYDMMPSSLIWEPQKLVIARAANWSLSKWELQRWSSGRKSAVCGQGRLPWKGSSQIDMNDMNMLVRHDLFSAVIRGECPVTDIMFIRA